MQGKESGQAILHNFIVRETEAQSRVGTDSGLEDGEMRLDAQAVVPSYLTPQHTASLGGSSVRKDFVQRVKLRALVWAHREAGLG